MARKIQPSPLDRALHLAGGPSALAHAIGVTPQAIDRWKRNGKVPIARCVDMEMALKGAMSRFDFLPPELSAKK